ncbi:MAG: LysM peptidoglycan-binding domain-containing M23 family metallopeptidase [Parvibaculales bacterium]
MLAALTAVLSACGPVQSGRWYDAEKDYDTYANVFNTTSPDKQSQVASVPRPSVPVSSGGGVVVVKPGDTYYSLARQHNLSVRDLIEANNAVAPYKLVKGQQLRVPVNNLYTVKKGDTLYSVSRSFNLDVSTLAKANALKPPYHIKVNQQLKLTGVASRRASVYDRKPAAAPPRKGKFILPADGNVISSYGAKANGIHNDGINIALPEGTDLKAAENGVVVYAGNELEGYGNLILLKHADNFVTAYAHTQSFNVKVGQKVKRGQVIAKSGQTGNVTRPQLHFEIRRGAQALNPKNYI